MEDMLGEKAPPFTLPSSENKPISLKDYKGQYLVVFFYPNDETSSGTIEALAFKKCLIILVILA
jgi:thioredoxin-dependent peroxiredoxin